MTDKQIHVVCADTGLPYKQVVEVWTALRESGYVIVPSHWVLLEPSVAVKVLEPLVRDLRDIAVSGKKFHYAEITGAKDITEDMVNQMIERSRDE